MKAGIHRIILPATLTFALCVAIFVSFVPKQAAALSMAPTANSKDQMVVIQKLLEQVKDLQKQLTDTQQAAGDGSGQLNTCLDIKNNFGYQSSDIFTNNEVSALQKFLQANGYLNIAPTGYYGPLTTEAVKSFQSASGIEASGYVGTQTRAKIKGITCPPAPIVDYINEDTTSSSTGGVINFGDDARYPYIPKPQITSFRLSSETFTRERDTITVNWSTNTSAVNCSIYRKESNGDAYTIASNLGSTTSYVLYAESIGASRMQAQFVLSCIGNTSGEAGSVVAEKQFTLSIVNVSTSPSCVLTADKSTYTLGDTIKLSWTSNNATYVTFSTRDSYKKALNKDTLPTLDDWLPKSGATSVKADVKGNSIKTLYVYDAQGASSSCAVVVSVVAAATTGTSTLFIGASVKTTNDLNVRETPSLSGAIITVEHAGAFGNVVDGPKDSDGHTWWKVQYESGVTGWSTGKSLEAQTLSL